MISHLIFCGHTTSITVQSLVVTCIFTEHVTSRSTASQLAVYLAAFIITKLVRIPQYHSHIIALVPHGHYNHVTLMYCLHFPKYILYMGTKQLKYTTFWLVEYFTHCKIKHKRLFSTDQSQQNIILSRGLQVIEWSPLSWNSFWNETNIAIVCERYWGTSFVIMKAAK